LNSFASADRVFESDIRRAAAQRSGASIRSDQVPPRNANSALPRITPRAARLAQTSGLDWTRLSGTGRHGRIREQDILAAASHSPAAKAAAESLPSIPGTLQPLSAVRRTIAQRMSAAAAQTVPVTLTAKVNAQALFDLRAEWKRQGAATTPSFNDINIHRAAKLLRHEPALNACWTDRGVYWYDAVHVAIAVDTDAGLLAPVIPHTDALTLSDLATQTRQLSQLARAGQLTPAQLRGGTFTITNLGMFGIDFFTPVINLPQSAILGIGRIADEPILVDQLVVPGKTLSLSLTFDHRVLDGAPAARWLQQLAEDLQQLTLSDAQRT
jgi:pyruvate dehydrogenase E2 component (dihydrolipoamide acetyltransferase)